MSDGEGGVEEVLICHKQEIVHLSQFIFGQILLEVFLALGQ